MSSSEADIEGWAREDTDLRGSGERRQRIQVKVCDRKDGTYHVCYRIRFPGRASISCHLKGEIHNSPFQVQFENSKLEPHSLSLERHTVPLVASGEVLECGYTIAGVTTTFTVECREPSREPLVNAILKPIDTADRESSSLSVSVTSKKGPRGPSSTKWTYSFNAKVTGSYLLFLSPISQVSNGFGLIKGNPWTLSVLAGKLDVGKSFVDFGALSMETYGLYQCRVFCRDAFGNP